jgi:hypothetical protein
MTGCHAPQAPVYAQTLPIGVSPCNIGFRYAKRRGAAADADSHFHPIESRSFRVNLTVNF